MGSIESKTARELLQKSEPIMINNNIYSIAPPTLATLVLVSEKIGDLDVKEINKEYNVANILAISIKGNKIAEVLAILILGAKEIKKEEQVLNKLSYLLKFKRAKSTKLSEEISYNLSVKEIKEHIINILSRLDLSDFFALTTFLNEVNLNRATREVVRRS